MKLIQNTYQKPVDLIAISLSAVCSIHCLAMPLIVVLLPSIASLGLVDEAFHFWMVVIVIPSSAFALALGCKQHKRYRLFFMGAIGLTLLALAVALGESYLSEIGEKTLTLIGAAVIALAHMQNYKLCARQEKGCHCPKHEEGASCEASVL